MNVYCKSIYLSYIDGKLSVLKENEELPTKKWLDDNIPHNQLKSYIDLDPKWCSLELVDTETTKTNLDIIFVAILPPDTKQKVGQWEEISSDKLEVSHPVIYKAIQRLK
jgi:hypothetical protein